MSLHLRSSRLLRLCLLSVCIALSVSHARVSADETKVDTNDMFTEQSAENAKERTKTINDINTFLISSYKLKVDRVLAELNASIGKATNNDINAQIQLLKKIQGDIAMKEEILRSKPISKNRKKILEAVFAHIQWNLSETIKKISKSSEK